jgi:hypothetical protein
MQSGPIPEEFLRGCGFQEEFLQALPQLRELAAKTSGCRISYSSADQRFARRLHEELQRCGVRCWLDEYPVMPAEAQGRPVSEPPATGERILLCCSHDSLNSWWVDRQLETIARAEARQPQSQGLAETALIPLSLDGYLLQSAVNPRRQQPLLSRPATDFSDWEVDPARFQAQIDSVVNQLRAGG